VTGPTPVGAAPADAALADFLRRHPDELTSGPVTPTPTGWYDAHRAAELTATHRAIVVAGYHTDRERHGCPDYWDIDAAGDCEDKALWCHRRLSDLGWPKSAMRLWLCAVQQAGRWRRHAVLVVHITIEDGTILETALDGLSRTPMRKDDLSYRMWQMVDPSGALLPRSPKES